MVRFRSLEVFSSLRVSCVFSCDSLYMVLLTSDCCMNAWLLNSGKSPAVQRKRNCSKLKIVSYCEHMWLRRCVLYSTSGKNNVQTEKKNQQKNHLIFLPLQRLFIYLVIIHCFGNKSENWGLSLMWCEVPTWFK